TQRQKQVVRRVLSLDPSSGTSALARLRSNLISPMSSSVQITPEMRGDDPHHKFKYRIRPGEESLDLVRTRSGTLEPRSALYRHLAWYVVHVIYPLYDAAPNKGAFRLRDQDAAFA